jgi:membrane protein
MTRRLRERALTGRLRERAPTGRLRERAPTDRLRERALDTSQRVVRAMGAHHAFEAAAAIAFWFFLSLLPLLVLAGFLVGQVARTRGVDALVGPLLEIVPATAEGVVRSEVKRLAGASATPLAPLGIAGYLWTASSGLHNLMDVFETAAHAIPRPWWKKRAIAIAWVVVGLMAACLLAWLLVRIDSLTHDHSYRATHALQHHLHVRLTTGGQPVVASGLMLLVGTALLGGFYRYAVDSRSRKRRSIWPGAVAAVAFWLVVSWGFSAYATTIGDYAFYYGSLAAVAVLLVWLYLTSLALVVGVEVNALLESRRPSAPGPPRDGRGAQE